MAISISSLSCGLSLAACLAACQVVLDDAAEAAALTLPSSFMVFVRRFKGKCLAQLLDDPTASRMLRDVNVQDASTIMADDEEAVVMLRAA